MAEVLQHSAAAQFAGIPGAGAGDVDRRLAECALPFELQFADKAGRRACQGDPAGVAYGHDLDTRANPSKDGNFLAPISLERRSYPV
jgi:hypothetical protein